MEQATDLWLFIREEAPGAVDALSEDSEITKGLKELMFLFSGTVRPKSGAKNNFTPLVSTGTFSGTMPVAEVRNMQRAGGVSASEVRNRRGKPMGIPQIIAALIESEPASTSGSDSASGTKPLKVVYVSDLDCMSSVFIDCL